MSGILNLDKAAGISSARALTDVKWLIPRRVKIGHAGTLDPFATGVLLAMIGKATKLSNQMMDAPKQYEATIRFGFTTASDDPESPETPFAPKVHPCGRADVLGLLPQFTGMILQKPSVYSAMKIGGKRACDWVREGREMEMAARTVMVHGIELVDFDWPHATLRIDCGKGTYIRSIARDLGIALNTGGYLTALRRTKVGGWDVKDACRIEMLKRDGVEKYLQSAAMD